MRSHAFGRLGFERASELAGSMIASELEPRWKPAAKFHQTPVRRVRSLPERSHVRQRF